jgi:hypothetical protein
MASQKKLPGVATDYWLAYYKDYQMSSPPTDARAPIRSSALSADELL